MSSTCACLGRLNIYFSSDIFLKTLKTNLISRKQILANVHLELTVDRKHMQRALK